MVSRPTAGVSFRFTASSAISRTVQRARPSGGGPHTMAMMRWLCLASSAGCLPGRGFLPQRRFQPFFFIAAGDGSHRLRRHAHIERHLRRLLPLIQLPQDQRTPQHPRRLPAPPQHAGDLLPVLLPHTHMHAMIFLHGPRFTLFPALPSTSAGTPSYGHGTSVVFLNYVYGSGTTRTGRPGATADPSAARSG